ncbi:hypothetical protein L6452_42487 [Arctium lappa]|uniref:Uncharacterized protein n=1 Tax=Arctium lappa TaxID=4217 RepID=A0ACB8XHX3_ARCLA|nr:hypothetical protein L6452_42487 [Arctium lappa]
MGCSTVGNGRCGEGGLAAWRGCWSQIGYGVAGDEIVGRSMMVLHGGDVSSVLLCQEIQSEHLQSSEVGSLMRSSLMSFRETVSELTSEIDILSLRLTLN